MLSSRVQGNVNIDAGTDTSVYGDGDLSVANDLTVGNDAVITGKLTVGGLIDPTGLVLDQQSSAPSTGHGPTKGCLWIQDNSPNNMIYTNGDDVDDPVACLNATQTFSNKTITSANNNVVEATNLRSTPISATIPTNGQQLVYNGNIWAPKDQYNPEVTVTFFDDFLGAEIDDSWIVDKIGASSNAVIVDGVGGQVKLQSGDGAGEYTEINTFTKCIKEDSNPNLKFRVKLSHITNTSVSIGYKDTDDEKVDFFYDATTAGNWFTRTVSGGISTTNDTGQTASTDWVVLQIIGSETEVNFYMNGSLISTHTTNVSAVLMKIFIRQEMKTAAVRSTLVDFVHNRSGREASGGGSGGSGSSGGCIVM